MKKPFSSPSRAPLFAVLGGALLLVGTVPVLAQTAPSGATNPIPDPAPAFSAPANTTVQAVGPNFKLQPGDVLAVQVANHPEMSATSVAVAANGKLNLPVVGTLSAQGKTIGQVSADITRAYSKQLKRPQVSITLVSSVARQLVVRGAVGKPGPIDVRSDLKLSEVISLAGGLMVPLNDQDLIIDLVKQLNLPVLLVSKHYLGSINHSLLSVEALQNRSIPILGIVFKGIS
ncbi:hypothetical protein EON80_27805 [bacterium]|nr:MAG: hypothetical protein EON80_27805 [bacterium]